MHYTNSERSFSVNLAYPNPLFSLGALFQECNRLSFPVDIDHIVLRSIQDFLMIFRVLP